MRQMLSVKIVAFEMSGENAVTLTYQFSNGKRITRITGLDEARKKPNRVGKFIQISVSDSEYETIFGKKPEHAIFYNGLRLSQPIPKPSVVGEIKKEETEEEEPDEEKEAVTVEYDDADAQISLFD